MGSFSHFLEAASDWAPAGVAVFLIIDGLRKIVSGEVTEERYYGNNEALGRRPDEVTTYFGWRAIAIGILEIAAGIATFIYSRN